MSSFALLASLALVQLLAAISPGPSFALVASRAAAGNRACALAAAAGVLSATATWIALAGFGAAALLAAAPGLYAACRVAGALYLIFVGLRMLRGAFRRGAGALAVDARAPALAACWRQGFLANIANPKSVAYCTSLFVAMLPPDAGSGLTLAAALVAFSASAAWWLSLALVLTTRALGLAFLRLRRAVDALMGAAMVALGLRLLATR